VIAERRVHCFVCMRLRGRRHRQQYRRHPRLRRMEERPRPWRGRTVDPLRVRKIIGAQTVGGGHKKRALAHGYSASTSSGLAQTAQFQRIS